MANICIIGNCQARSLSLSPKFSGHRMKYYLSSILAWDTQSRLQDIKADLRSKIPEETLTALLRSGHIRINAPLRDILGTGADHFVLTLFHEAPYFLHKTKGYGLTVSMEGLDEKSVPAYMSRFLADEFISVHPDEKTYYERFYNYISDLKNLCPRAATIIVSRLKTGLFQKPTKSWIAHWDGLQHGMDDFLQRCRSDFDSRVVDMPAIAESLTAQGYEPADIAPFDIDISYRPDGICISSIYDIEHLHAPFWDLVADQVLRQIDPCRASEPYKNQKFTPVDSWVSKAAVALSHCVRYGDPARLIALMKSATDYDSKFSMLTAVEAASLLACGDKLRDEIDRYISSFPDGDATVDGAQVRARIGRIRNHLNGHRAKNIFHSKDDIVLWGAGGRCRMFLGLLNEKEIGSIKCIFDSNMELHGTFIKGIPVFHPSRFKECGIERMSDLIIMSHYFEEIVCEARRHELFSDTTFLRSDDIFHNLVKQCHPCVSI